MTRTYSRYSCLVRPSHTVNLWRKMLLFSLNYNFISLTHFNDKVCCQAGSSLSHQLYDKVCPKKGNTERSTDIIKKEKTT